MPAFNLSKRFKINLAGKTASTQWARILRGFYINEITNNQFQLNISKILFFSGRGGPKENTFFSWDVSLSEVNFSKVLCVYWLRIVRNKVKIDV